MLDSSVREINKSNSEREEMKLKEKQGGRESAGRSMCELLLHNHNFVFSKECARPREQPAGSY